MTTEQAVWLAAGAAAVALLAVLVALRARSRAVDAELASAALAERVAVLESLGGPAPVGEVPTAVAADATTYVITAMDEAPGAEVPATPLARPIDGRLFTDIVAREAVVSAASWTHGLRRALSPASRNRIRFEVRQEARRAGRERRAEMKQALREFRARERAAASGSPEAVHGEVRGDVA